MDKKICNHTLIQSVATKLYEYHKHLFGNQHALLIPTFTVACNNDSGSPFPDNARVVAHGD